MNSTARNQYPEVCFLGWLAILVWAPLPLASNRPWALALLILLCALLALGLFAVALLSNRSLLGKLRPYRAPIILLALAAGWSSLQLVPLPLDLLQSLSPNTATVWQDLGETAGPLSLDPGRTQYQAAFSWALWLFFIATVLLLDSQRRVRRAGMVIVVCGVAQALYGSFMTLSGIEYGFFIEKYAYRGVATGTFVNRNHLAGYLEMCLAVGIGLLVASLSRRSSGNWRARARRLLDTLLGSKMRLRIFLALMVIALVLTRSRMGNTAFFASLLICGGGWMLLQRKLHKGAIILFVSLLLVDTLIVGQWFGFEEVAQRLQSTTAESETRDEVVRDTLVMIQDYPLTGTGLGSYAVAFPRYQRADVRGFYDHAHNDYLQFTAELGVIGMLPLVLLVLWSLGRAVHAIMRRRDNLAKGIAFAATMGILSLLIHSVVDFNLQMPANAQLFIVLIAFAWIAGALRHESHGE